MNRMVPVALLLACAVGASAKHGWKHADRPYAGAPVVQVNVLFGGGDVRVIRDYYRGSGLPLGIEKHLRRKGTLPPGIAKKIAPFPYDLERRLPPLPPGIHRGYYGSCAVLYDPVSRIIYDVADIVVAARGI